MSRLMRSVYPIGLAMLLMTVGIVPVWKRPPTPALQIVGWAALVVSLVLLLWGTLGSLAGPVFHFDAIRTARRGRAAVLRALYCAVLLFVLFLVYINWFGLGIGEGAAGLMEEHSIHLNDQAQFAQSFFRTFLVVQFGVMVVLTPAFTAGLVVEEKERGTLDDLTLTELTTAEVIVGKLLSRVSHLILLQLAGVPVLALLQLLGGVSPSLLVAGFLYTLVCTLSMGALSVAVSMYTSRTRRAVLIGLITVIGYQLIASIVGSIVVGRSGKMPQSPIDPVRSLIGSIGVGSAFTVVERHEAAGTLGDELPLLLLQYLYVHVVLTIVFLVLAGLLYQNLRVGEKRPSLTPSRYSVAHAARRRPRLRTEPPMQWKERYFGSNLLGRDLAYEFKELRLACFILAGVLLALTALALAVSEHRQSEARSLFVSGMAMLFVVVTFIESALHASGTISIEKEQQTLPSLLATDLTAGEILEAKWWGCLSNPIGPLIGIGLAVLGASLVSPIPLLGFFPAVMAILVQGCLVITLGMYCSLVSRTSFRAAVSVFVALLALGLGHWLLFLVESAVLHLCGLRDWVELVRAFHAHGLTPTIALTDLVTLGGGGDDAAARFALATTGTLLYAILTLGLAWRLQRRFIALAGRRE